MREPHFLDLGTLEVGAAAYVKGLQLGTVIQDGFRAHPCPRFATTLIFQDRNYVCSV
jgi:hypothetical protein